MTRNTIAYYAFNFLFGLYLATGTTVLFERELGLSFSQIFTLDAMYMLMFILFEIPSGALSDLLGRKKAMYVGSGLLVLGALATGNSHTFEHLFLSFFLWAFGFSLFSGSAEAMLYDTIGDEKIYQRIYGRALFFSVIGVAIAGIIGPLLYEQHFRLPYLLSGIPFALSAIALYFFVEKEEKKEAFSVERYFKQMKEGTRLAFSNRFILWSMGLLSLVFAVGYTFTSSYQPYLQEVGFSLTDFAYIIPIMFVIEAFGGMGSEKITSYFGETLSFWINVLAMGASLVLLGVLASKTAMPLLFVYAFFAGVLRPFVSSYANRYIQSSHRATVISVQAMFSTITASALLFLFGFLTDKIGVVALAAVIGSLVLIVGTSLLLLKPKGEGVRLDQSTHSV